MASPWTGIIEDARHYPSPHNSQPIVVRVEDDRTATVFYDLRRGLPAESFGIPFGHVCAGVFLAGLDVVARAHGFAVQERLDHAEMDFGRLDADPGSDDRLHRLGTVALRPRAATADDREALARFLARRTSRRPYDATLVDESAIEAVSAIASAAGQRFRTTADRAVVEEIVRVNQETLFDDLRHDAVHEEILHWLRFSKRQAAETGDGLSAETMLMPGPVLRFAMEHRGLWEAPGVGGLFRRVYLSTMRGVRQLGWLEGPFSSPAEYVEDDYRRNTAAVGAYADALRAIDEPSRLRLVLRRWYNAAVPKWVRDRVARRDRVGGVVGHVRPLVEHGTDVVLIASPVDVEVFDRLGGQRALRRWSSRGRTGRVDLVRVPEGDHSLFSPLMRQAVLSEVRSRVASTFPVHA
ncbi:hypothetical protein [Curtobacterium sp. B18]|uniref:hypothetical protein n=1 Tax=Curtobacterium sp. B18 TaxID=95614 RepID=UPI000346CD0C|nr:hypothetical protein [Curtobacterium sp. B18]